MSAQTVERHVLVEQRDDLPCRAKRSFHSRHGRGPAAWLVFQKCAGCGRVDRDLACQGCWDAVSQMIADRVSAHHLTGGCLYYAPVSDFIIRAERLSGWAR